MMTSDIVMLCIVLDVPGFIYSKDNLSDWIKGKVGFHTNDQNCSTVFCLNGFNFYRGTS